MVRKLVVVVSLYASALTAAHAADLTVTVSGIRNASGSVSAGIFNSESSFARPSEAFASFRIKATQASVGFTVHDLPMRSRLIMMKMATADLTSIRREFRQRATAYRTTRAIH